MARHRNVRGNFYDDELDGYDDVYGHSLEDDNILSSSENSQWIFDRNRSTLTSYYEEPEDQCEYQPNSDTNLTDKLDDLQKAKLLSCLDEIRDVLGDSISEDIIIKTVINENYNVQLTLDKLLNSNTRNSDNINFSNVPTLKNTDQENITSEKNSTNLHLSTEPINISNSNITSELPQILKSTKLNNENLSTVARTRSPSPDIKNTLKSEISDDKLTLKQKENKTNPETLYVLERGADKENLFIVVIGHVDAGKSTLMGRLLCDLGEVSQRTLHKYEQESKKVGKQSFMYAWVLDETGEERLRGITMDVGRVHFSTKSKKITVLDAPGHADFIPNMIAGAGQADVALLVVDATRGEFETGFDLGGQTREHALLVRSLGINQIAVAVNKLDTTEWSQERFNEICLKLKTFLKQAGFKESDVTYVPLSGLTGENLISNSKEKKLSKWYKGPCLIDVIDKFKPPERPVSKPFRMSINDIYKGTGTGFCIFGKVETGILNTGDKLLICPIKESAVVKSIFINDTPQTVAFAGDQISVTLLGFDMQSISVGFILCDPLKPVSIATVFEARIVVFNIKVPITNGYPVVIHHQSLVESANIVKLKASINKSTGEIIKKKPRCLGKNSVAVVNIEVSKPICMELYKDIKELGRIMLRVSGVTIAAGLVTAIIK